jgi:hypothetical protein
MSSSAAGLVGPKFKAHVSGTHSSGGRVFYHVQLETSQPETASKELARTYTDFINLRAALATLPGGSDLPALPAKTLFATKADIALRTSSFNSLLAVLAANEQLARSDATVAFFAETAPLDLEATRRDLLRKGKAIAALGQTSSLGAAASTWGVQYSKNGIEIATAIAPNSPIYYVRSRLELAGVSVARAFQLYTVSTKIAHAACTLADPRRVCAGRGPVEHVSA